MLHRRGFCKALAMAPATLAAPMLMRSAFAENSFVCSSSLKSERIS